MATFWAFGCAVLTVAHATHFWRDKPTPNRISTANRALPLIVTVAGLGLGTLLWLSDSAWAEVVFQLSALTSMVLNTRRSRLDGTFRGPFASRAALGLSDAASPSVSPKSPGG